MNSRMAFSCNECSKTWPDRYEQTGTIGNPKYCHECYDPEKHAEDDDDGSDDGPVVEAEKEDGDDPHPWDGMIRH